MRLGYVALDELYDYVYDRVRAVTPNQTPGKWTFGVQGDLYIARRSRRWLIVVWAYHPHLPDVEPVTGQRRVSSSSPTGEGAVPLLRGPQRGRGGAGSGGAARSAGCGSDSHA